MGRRGAIAVFCLGVDGSRAATLYCLVELVEMIIRLNDLIEKERHTGVCNQ